MDAGLTASVYGLAAALTSLVSGIYADKIKENEYIMILGYSIMGLAFILFFLCRQYLVPVCCPSIDWNRRGYLFAGI
jgi:predicted MFS family arabinose efflux permease